MDVEQLKRTRRVLKRDLSRLKDQMMELAQKSSLNLEQVTKLETISISYKNQMDEYSAITNQLLALLDETSDSFEADEKDIMQNMTKVSDIYYTVQGKIAYQRQKLCTEQARNSLVPPASSSSSPSLLNQTMSDASVPSQFTPKLQKIPIPKFDGEILNFRNFKSLFEDLVHSSSELSNVQKLWWLKEAMGDDIKDILRDFPLEDGAYIEAWNYLAERFDNKRLVIRTLFKRLLSLEPIKNASQICTLLDKADVLMRGLRSYGEETDQGIFSKFVSYIVSTKLDKITLREWENSVTSHSEFPLYKKLHTFLKSRIFSEEGSNLSTNFENKVVTKPVKKTVEKKVEKSSFSVSSRSKCHACPDSHVLIECPTFLKKTPEQRYEIVKLAKICINCFGQNHASRFCNRAPCKECKRKHHSLLHFDKPKVPASDSSSDSKTDVVGSELEKTGTVETKSCSASNSHDTFILLPTAVVSFTSGGTSGLLRLMFDCASQPTAIVDTFVDKHNLKTYKSKTSIGGVGGQINCTRSCSIVLGSRFSSFEIPIEADVVPQTSLTYFVPSEQMEIARQAAHTLKLADQSLSYKGVDLILGNAYYEACVLNSTTTINGIIFRNTNFGWTPTGPIPKLISSTCNTMTVSSCFATSTQEIQDDLQKFWESEEVQPIESTKKAEQILCEQHFENTTMRKERKVCRPPSTERVTLVVR